MRKGVLILYILLFFNQWLLGNISNKNKPLDEDIIWQEVIIPYLKDSLWSAEYKYDAAHFLMVLMHDAFENNNHERIDAFNSHFSNLNRSEISLKTKNRTHDLQYLYFVSEYLSLIVRYDLNNELIPILFNRLYNEIEVAWNNERCRISNRDIKKYFYFKGFKKRIDWKLNDTLYRSVVPYKAIVDVEHYTFAIAANLNYVIQNVEVDKNIETLKEILDYAYGVYKSRITYKEDGIWYFQLGYYDESRDHCYSAYQTKDSVTTKKSIKNISGDSNHFQRFPIWLLTFSRGDSSRKEFYQKLHGDIEKTILENIVVLPNELCPYVRTNNFMDGNNGLYRWNYTTLNKNDGYGPYELSYAFLQGWYSFAKKKSVCEIFEMTSEQFPIPTEDWYLYSDKTQRKRHSAVENAINNGFFYVISKAAARLQ